MKQNTKTHVTVGLWSCLCTKCWQTERTHLSTPTSSYLLRLAFYSVAGRGTTQGQMLCFNLWIQSWKPPCFLSTNCPTHRSGSLMTHRCLQGLHGTPVPSVRWSPKITVFTLCSRPHWWQSNPSRKTSLFSLLKVCVGVCLWSSLGCITGPLLNSHMRMTWGFHCRIELTLIERRVSPCGHRAVHENSQTLMQIKYDLTGAFIVCLRVYWAMRSAENRTRTTDESFYFTLKKSAGLQLMEVLQPNTIRPELLYIKKANFSVLMCVKIWN